MIAALLLTLPASPKGQGAGATLPTWTSALGLKTDRTSIDRRIHLARNLRAEAPTATLATLLPAIPTCRLLTTPIGRPVPRAVRATWTKETDDRVGAIEYVKSDAARSHRTSVNCDRRGRIVAMGDIHEGATAAIRADMAYALPRLRRAFGDPTDLDDGPPTRSLTLLWRWSSGASLTVAESETPKGTSLLIGLSR